LEPIIQKSFSINTLTMKRLIWILLFALLLALILRVFVFESFRVASDAMAGHQVAGNRLLVEKWTNGARLPQSLKRPFSSKNDPSYWNISNRIIRTPALSGLERNDLVVFNDPRSSKDIPVDQRPVLLSRVVGLPGEFVELKGFHLYINDVEQQRSVDALFCFRFLPSRKTQVEKLVKEKLTDREFYQKKDTGFIFLANFEYLKLINERALKGNILRPYVSGYDLCHTSVPAKSDRIVLNDRTYEQWGALINKYEGVTLKQMDTDRYEVDGKPARSYSFRQDYFWVLNDHQGYLNDSRTIGLIPSSHLIGRACLVLFSPDDGRFLQKIQSL
jgi:signal peptidase I